MPVNMAARMMTVLYTKPGAWGRGGRGRRLGTSCAVPGHLCARHNASAPLRGARLAELHAWFLACARRPSPPRPARSQPHPAPGPGPSPRPAPATRLPSSWISSVKKWKRIMERFQEGICSEMLRGGGERQRGAAGQQPGSLAGAWPAEPKRRRRSVSGAAASRLPHKLQKQQLRSRMGWAHGRSNDQADFFGCGSPVVDHRAQGWEVLQAQGAEAAGRESDAQGHGRI